MENDVYVCVHIHTYVYIAESLSCIAETNTTLWINYTLKKKNEKQENKPVVRKCRY